MSNSDSITIKNLEAAFAGESMAHIKYLYFARVCRAQGDEETARVFEQTAAQEVQHAFGHLDLLMPADQLDPARCLELAIEGETHEYTEMYPKFRHLAEQEQNHDAVREFDEQIEESKEHAEQFRATLEKAARRFAALTKVEKKHADHYQSVLDGIKS
ncbi:MAG TPA: rubrerythrin [Thiotrichales bacterium]|nr:rubrerythrin [Thiotrichales bacterium]